VQRIYGVRAAGYFKDAFHAVNSQKRGTKAAVHYIVNVPGGGTSQLRLRGVGASHQTGWTGVIAKLLQSRTGYKIRSGWQEVRQ
jgi:hypothetical protein